MFLGVYDLKNVFRKDICLISPGTFRHRSEYINACFYIYYYLFVILNQSIRKFINYPP